MLSAPLGRAIVHVPEAFDPTRPVHLVFFFHGVGVCIGQFLGEHARCGAAPSFGPGCGGPDHFDALDANAILVIPQLRYDRRDVLARSGALRVLVEELLHDTLPRAAGLPRLELAALDGITLVAHSAGHRALERGLSDANLAPFVHNVVLFDTVPAGTATYLRWLSLGATRRRLTILHTEWQPSCTEAAALVERARGISGVRSTVASASTVIAAMASNEVVSAVVRFDHGWLPWLYFPKVLGALGLPPRASSTQDSPDRELVPIEPMTAVPLALGDTFHGALDASDHRARDGSAIDTYLLSLAAGQRVDIRVRGARSRTNRAVPLDVLAAVYDGDHEIARDDDSLGGLGSRLELTAGHAGNYDLRVTSYGSGLREGDYRLEVADPGASGTRRRAR